jgi:hypothetical protein
MIPVFQTKFKGVDGSNCGNCLAAAIASILEIPLFLVPQFEEGFASHGAKWQIALARFTAGHGLDTETFVTDPMLDRPYLATGVSPRSAPDNPFNHCVVYQSGKLIHDPYPGGNGVIDPFFFSVYTPIDYNNLESAEIDRQSNLDYLIELQNGGIIAKS